MNNLPDHPTREDVLKFISRSASYGNLGAFIGAGFSKAVLNDGFNDIALSWGELLEAVANNLGIDYANIWKEGVGYPEIASQLCEVELTPFRGQFTLGVEGVHDANTVSPGVSRTDH